MVRVRVNYIRDTFSVLLRAHHYSMLMTFVSATTANNIEMNIQVHIINPVHVNEANWESLVYNNYCRMVRNCVHDAEGLIACHAAASTRTPVHSACHRHSRICRHSRVDAPDMLCGLCPLKLS